jgi:NAD(P)-dependent dehydrogenase (short-subunit alcohol dehydrogenase family)
MDNLFIGGSSQIAIEIAKSFKNSFSLSRKKNSTYKKSVVIKKYNKKEIIKGLKKFNKKFDNILIFNGFFRPSLLTKYDETLFNKIINTNLKLPLLICKIILEEKILNFNSSIYFISSLAALKPMIGNAYYAISKNSLNFSCKILSLEQKKRGIRFNTISFGLIKNRMGYNLLNELPIIKKNQILFSNIKKIKKEMSKILNSKNFNGKNFILK